MKIKMSLGLLVAILMIVSCKVTESRVAKTDEESKLPVALADSTLIPYQNQITLYDREEFLKRFKGGQWKGPQYYFLTIDGRIITDSGPAGAPYRSFSAINDSAAKLRSQGWHPLYTDSVYPPQTYYIDFFFEKGNKFYFKGDYFRGKFYQPYTDRPMTVMEINDSVLKLMGDEVRSPDFGVARHVFIFRRFNE